MSSINKESIINLIAAKTSISKKEVGLAIESFTDIIKEELRKGNKIILTGFGTFRVSKRASREGINPQTKERIQIPALNIPKFTAGKNLKEGIK